MDFAISSLVLDSVNFLVAFVQTIMPLSLPEYTKGSISKVPSSSTDTGTDHLSSVPMVYTSSEQLSSLLSPISVMKAIIFLVVLGIDVNVTLPLLYVPSCNNVLETLLS